MHISQLFVYPIKSLRGCEVQSALLTRHGFHLDRRFILMRSEPATATSPAKLTHMQISKIPAMCLFSTFISSSSNTLTVHYTPSADPSAGLVASASSISIPVEPETFQGLERVDVNMYGSPNEAVNMGERYNAWFSEHFGFPVVLAFWGFNPRLVLGNLPYQPATAQPKSLSSSSFKTILSKLPIIGPLLVSEDEEEIAFNDVAPYLVISDSSVSEVSTRLPEKMDMDLTKFRGNIVVKGSEAAYSEDFWSELTFCSSKKLGKRVKSKILLTGNCGRCASLNIDHSTGKPVTDPATMPLKLLSKDRRVDPGMKYSPVFGRYGFLDREAEGRVLRVGDRVDVSRRNEERTRFCEYHLSLGILGRWYRSTEANVFCSLAWFVDLNKSESVSPFHSVSFAHSTMQGPNIHGTIKSITHIILSPVPVLYYPTMIQNNPSIQTNQNSARSKPSINPT